MKGTWYLPIANLSSSNYAAVRALVANGTIEVAAHAAYHTALTYAHGIRVTVASGGANPTVAFDGTTITLSSDGRTAITIDTSAAAKDTIGEICTTYADDGGGTWTLARSTTDSQIDAQIDNTTPATTLKTMTATAVPTDIDFDQITADCTGGTGSPFWDVMIYDARTTTASVVNGAGDVTDPQMGAVYVCNSQSNPFNLSNINVETATRTSGFTNARAGTYTGAQHNLGNSMNLYQHRSVNCSGLIGSTVAETKARARSVAMDAAISGKIVYLLAHNEGECSTTDENGWKAILDTFSELHTRGSLVVTSAQLATVAVKTSPWTYTAATGISTRTYATYGDYRLKADSLAINAGTDVGLTTDFLGKPIRGLPDIGAYEFYGGAGQLGMGMIYGF
jgi:hypothetical protein